MTQEKEFLELFNQLEQYLRVSYTSNAYSYTGFMSTIYRIKKAKKNPVIANNYNFDIIKQASQIRNIIAHNNDVVLPTESFMKKFTSIVHKICNPMRVENIMVPFSKLKTVAKENTIEEAIAILQAHGFNTLPIIEHGDLLGFFTEKSLYDYLSIFQNNSVDKHMKILDIMDVLDLNNEPREYFAFVGRKMLVEDAYEHFDKDRKRRRDLLLLLVTEHGERTEKLLGIVTLRDIENALLD